MSAFEPSTVFLTGRFDLSGRIDAVFPLFSPLGEKEWVDGWDPEILHPRGASWEQGMVFRTRMSDHEEIWVVAELDPTRHRVVYYRTEPGILVARVEVQCVELAPDRTAVETSYSYVGLTERGNDEIAAWTDAAYADKMRRWQTTITRVLNR